MVEFCADCFKGGVISGEPEGTMEKIAGIDCYVAPAAPQTTKAIIVGYDIFGFYVVNPKIIADILSRETGMQVFVPDALLGDYVKSMEPAPKPYKKHGLVSSIKGTTANVYKLVSAGAIGVMTRMDYDVMFKRYEDTIKEIKEKRGVQTVGIVGYCLGAHFCGLAAQDPNLIKCAVLCHPGGKVSAEMIKKAKVPLSFACGEEDYVLSNKERDAIQEVLKSLDVESELKIYDGCNHGFAARPDLSDEEQKKGFEKALQQTVDWFKKYV
ncbi:alpha/beta-hydrolase [Atractiella rhizophila]|nr:alpha/beta-hydrolase [Atractiella rhizophila]